MCVTLFRPTSPVLYKPTFDLGPVLALRLPEHINALDGIPRTESIVEGGFNKLLGKHEGDGRAARRELFYSRKVGTWKEGFVDYQFILFHTDDAAIKHYDFMKNLYRVFRETTENGLAGRVYYTEEPRADPEAGSGPTGSYISRADFCLHNLYVRVEANGHQKPPNDRLTEAIRELAHMLSAALEHIN